ncbi:uncharacterized protein cp110 isoform X1 [Paramisgurnus dabryanus]|uniref:uncharacterized protein cp110 isoform X1 n=1 Tax=Paramisgurnus dabryanus TaxID=90735 RepID=UPI0031F36175
MMESYEDFIQRHCMSLADEDDQSSLFKPSSVIVFHGVCILPPLLSEQQRDEMRHLRESVSSLMKSRRQQKPDSFKGERVTADVQRNIISTKQQTCDDDATQCEENVTCRPLTSTTHDGQPANQLRAFPGDDSLDKTQITVLFKGTSQKTHTTQGLHSQDEFDNHSDKLPQNDISHQMMMSSGYVTNENTDVTCDSSWMEKQDAVENSQTSSGFCLNVTGTGSDIISHAPVDGSALEEENTIPASNPTVDVTEPVKPSSEPDTDEGPYRMSLQNLLKKSQDYRRRQRLLRSQARALESADEHSMSDKENQEFLPNQIWKNARETRKVKIQPPDAEPATDDEISKETCRSSASDAHPEEHHDALTEDIAAPSHSTSKQLPVTARSLYLSKQKPMVGSRSSSAVGKKFTSVPAPKFCLSPIRSKKGSSIPVPVRKALVCVDRDADSDPNRGSVDDGVIHVGRSSEQTEQITQLELNLSSLKALISDLESTLTLSQADPAVDNSSYMLNKEEVSPDICLSALTSNKTLQQDVTAVTNSHPSQIRFSKSVHTIERSNHHPQQVGILTDSSNHKTNEKKKQSCEERSSPIDSSLCQSYDVDAPSCLWTQGKQLTPEMGGNEGVSRAKRRLLMNEVHMMSPGREIKRLSFSTPRVLESSAQLQPDDRVKVLLEEERRQQQDLLQSLAERYQFLRSVSFQRPSTGSRLEDDSTSSAFTSPSHTLDTSRVRPVEHTQNITIPLLTDICSPSVCLSVSQQFRLSVPASCRPLLAAAVKGFLTRRLLRTERVSQLIRTIQDTQQFLHQTAVRGEFSSRQDLMLHDRVSLQLRAARYEFHNIVFNSSICERMKMIGQDRQVTRERRFKQHGNKVKGSLSAATRKALERKRLAMLQKKSTTERTKISPSVMEKWTLVPKICRVSKKASPR